MGLPCLSPLYISECGQIHSAYEIYKKCFNANKTYIGHQQSFKELVEMFTPVVMLSVIIPRSDMFKKSARSGLC